MLKILKLIVLLIVFISSYSPVSADGGFFVRDIYLNEDLYEPEQKAIIFHDKGRETLLIQAQKAGMVSDFSWIIPTPGLPELGVADKNIFEEVHKITMPLEIRHPLIEMISFGIYRASSLDGYVGSQNVVVYEKKKIGLYDTTVLSSDNPENLQKWLIKNSYHIPENGLSVIKHYTDKKWFFTAIKIDEGALGIIKDLKKFDQDIIDIESALRILSESVVESFKNENLFSKITNYRYSITDADRASSTIGVAKIIELPYYNNKKKYFDNIKDKASVKEGIKGHIYSNLFGKVGLDEDYLKGLMPALELKFDSDDIVYPLKISSVNPGKTEVLMYVFTEDKVKAAGFQMEYANDLTKNSANKYLDKYFDRDEYYLTKLRANLSQNEMNDVVFERAGDNKSYVTKIYEKGKIFYYGLSVLIFGILFIYFLLISFSAARYYNKNLQRDAVDYFGIKSVFLYSFIIAGIFILILHLRLDIVFLLLVSLFVFVGASVSTLAPNILGVVLFIIVSLVQSVFVVIGIHKVVNCKYELQKRKSRNDNKSRTEVL